VDEKGKSRVSPGTHLRLMGVPNRRIWLWLGGAALCLVAGYAGMRFRQRPSPASADPARPSLKAAPRVEAGGASRASRPAPLVEPAAKPVEATPAPEAGARTEEDWLKLLAALAGEDYARQHPGILEKLAALLVAHPGDEVWEAGAVAYLARGMTGEAATAFWEKAAEALPENLAVSDKLMRTALEQMGNTDAPSTPESRAKLDALLARQALRTPQDPQVAWLRAWAAFEDGRGEDGEGLLKAAMAFPAWQEKAGVAELGELDVREAVDGPQSPLVKLAVMMDLQLPALRRMRALSKRVVESAAAMKLRGEPERARDLLLAADGMGRAYSDGSHLTLSYLVGGSLQLTVARALREQAMSAGNLAAREEADRRLAFYDEDRKAFRTWMNTVRGDQEGNVEELFKRLGLDVWSGVPQSERAIENAALLMMDADRRQLEGYARQWTEELAAFRAWKAKENP
jgi:hypothetical protein